MPDECPCPPGTVMSPDCIVYVDTGCIGCSGIVSPAHDRTCGVEPGPHWVSRMFIDHHEGKR